MDHLNWIAREVHNIHDWFQAVFYLLVTVFLLVSVFIEYFKLPLGQTPSFAPMVGRVLIAAIALHAYPQIHNLMADISDALCQKLGDTTGLKYALDRMADKVDQLSWSWVSIRQNIIVAISFLCFLILYFSVHVAQALYLYTLVILYTFSPILIALYVLPQTAGATSALFRSLIEASMWKPVWCAIATILWSSGVSDIQAEGSSISFVSAVCFSLIAAGSLVLTPRVIHHLAGAGMSAMAGSFSNIGIDGIASITPIRATQTGWNIAGRAANNGLQVADYATASNTRVNKFINSMPRFNVPQMKRPFVMIKKHKHSGVAKKEGER
ncbi:MAG: hypothetical protein HY537_05670 [Deltaproteobacteria bacterium]|nr:hypothetical protein [Deltaproteobacteria bacterium]